MILSELIPNDPISWIITIIIAMITFYLANFYHKVLNLPPGPLPLPLIGNILSLRGTKSHSSIEFMKLQHKYGSVITFWAGPKPFVFIFDIDLGREAFKKNEFSGRPLLNFGKEMFQGNTNIIFADYGPQWESLRRVAHSAVRKFAVSERLSYLVCDVVDDVVKSVKEKEINTPFDPFNMVYLMFFNILASIAFGKRYENDDPEFIFMKYNLTDFFKEAGDKLLLTEFIPILRPFYRKLVKEFEKGFKELIEKFKEKYVQHLNDYEDENIRDFTDSLIFAKKEALKENKESAPYLQDESLALALFDLFTAGTDTSQHTFRWLILFMANYPEMQKKMRNEIESIIGDRIPLHDDRNRCDYINAFMAEAMRFKPVAPIGLFHRTLIPSKIGKHKIPADTIVFIHQLSILNDPKYWKDPEEFIPERFLNNGKFMTQKPIAYIPFGTGRRICLGEKLAINDLFLVLVRFLQNTNGYEISLIDGPGSGDLEADPNFPDNFTPKDFKIILKKI